MPDEIDAGEQADIQRLAAARRWTLDQTLTWVATRDMRAVATAPGSAVSIWIAMHPGSYPHSTEHEAWSDLAEAMTEGLQALATRTSLSKTNEVVATQLGIPFPPADAPGAPTSYRLYRVGNRSVLRPKAYPLVHEWFEFTDLNFRREEILAAFVVKSITSTAEEHIASTAAAENRCREWLEALMRASPHRGPKPKQMLKAQARSEQQVAGRAFDRAWDKALSSTGAKWNLPAAHRKGSNNRDT